VATVVLVVVLLVQPTLAHHRMLVALAQPIKVMVVVQQVDSKAEAVVARVRQVLPLALVESVLLPL
jgi:hypothetical protein